MLTRTAATFLGLFATALPPTRAQDAGGDPALEDAIRAIFRGRAEPEIRGGMRTCLAKGDAKAIGIVLKALDGPNPHVRDIAWEVLTEFKDPYARRRVADELENNKDNAGVRHWCAELLGIYGDADWLRFLIVALKDKDIEVARAAARSLGMLRQREAIKHLEVSAKNKDPRLRADSIIALARLDAAAFGKLFRAGLSDKDGGVRCALLGAAPQLFPDDHEAMASAALTDTDWRPRMQAVDNLAQTKTKGAVDGLIVLLQDGRPAVRLRALGALQSLTGQKYSKLIEWSGWWKANAATFAFAEAKASAHASASADSATVASFHGVRIESDHCVFLIDNTPSMEKPLAATGTNKLEAAAQEFEATLRRLLDTGISFNVALYNETFDPLNKVAVPLNKKSLPAALEHVRAAKQKGSKNIWNALSTAVADSSVDTVILLSSGEPEVGDYVHWNRVTRHLQDLNRFHKVVVHTVAYSDVEWYLEQLRKIAEVTGGTCKEVH